MALAGGGLAGVEGQIVAAQTSCPIGRQQAARLNGHPPNPLHIILISDRLIISKSPHYLLLQHIISVRTHFEGHLFHKTKLSLVGALNV